MKQICKNGDLDTLPDDVYMRMYNTAKKIRVDSAVPIKRGKQIVLLLYGPPGTGKTRAALSMFPDAYIKAGNNKWWSSYQNEKVVILEEFCGGVPLENFNTWLDRPPCLVETKHGSTYLNTTTWIITSNLLPGDWYPCAPDGKYTVAQIQAVDRRIDRKVHVTSLDVAKNFVESKGYTWLCDDDSVHENNKLIEPYMQFFSLFNKSLK